MTKKKNKMVKVGESISFYLDTWPKGKHQSVLISAIVEDYILDPLGKLPRKYQVTVDGCKMGIPEGFLVPEIPFPKNAKTVTSEQ